MKANMVSVKIEESDIIKDDARPAAKVLAIKFNPDNGTILDLRTGKELEIHELAKYFDISLEQVNEILEWTAKYYETGEE